jgi:hypothetical protein
MPALTRRRSADRRDCWHIYYGDVDAGTIAKRVGSPHVTNQWEWRCGFYPGSSPGEIRRHSRDVRRCPRQFWRRLEDLFCEPHRCQFRGLARTTRFDHVEICDVGFSRKLPTQVTSGRSKCFCGADLTIGSVPDHVRSAHREMA